MHTMFNMAIYACMYGPEGLALLGATATAGRVVCILVGMSKGGGPVSDSCRAVVAFWTSQRVVVTGCRSLPLVTLQRIQAHLPRLMRIVRTKSFHLLHDQLISSQA